MLQVYDEYHRYTTRVCLCVVCCLSVYIYISVYILLFRQAKTLFSILFHIYMFIKHIFTNILELTFTYGFVSIPTLLSLAFV